MRMNIFNNAKDLIKDTKIELKTDSKIFLKIGEQEVVFFYKPIKYSKLDFSCTCQHGSLYPGTLCKHICAGINLLTEPNGR
jgi:hypothetical protein